MQDLLFDLHVKHTSLFEESVRLRTLSDTTLEQLAHYRWARADSVAFMVTREQRQGRGNVLRPTATVPRYSPLHLISSSEAMAGSRRLAAARAARLEYEAASRECAFVCHSECDSPVELPPSWMHCSGGRRRSRVSGPRHLRSSSEWCFGKECRPLLSQVGQTAGAASWHRCSHVTAAPM